MSVPPSASSSLPRLPDLSADERRALVKLARYTIAVRLDGQAAGPLDAHPVFDRPGGAFVTVTIAGDLRGCVGVTELTRPLGEVVRHCAAAAAFEDPRFVAIGAGELSRLGIEISVLSDLAPVEAAAIDRIEIGRHGLVVARGWRRGLLLPQVAVEHGWTAEQFLAHTCLKGGLAPDAWRRDARIEVFEAVVFGDGETRA